MAKNKAGQKTTKAAKASKKNHARANGKKNTTDIQAQAAIATCAENAKKTAQPGIIACIMDELTKAKKSGNPVTAAEILTVLEKKFPQREATGMMITVRAQLSRLPQEKKFGIDKVRDGRVVRYAAA